MILIVSDDQPYGTIERMPFLSSEPGFTEFGSYYDNNPLCCPTRATLLTGLYSHNHGIVTNLVAEEFDPSSTLATWLRGERLRDRPLRQVPQPLSVEQGLRLHPTGMGRLGGLRRRW